MVEQCAFVAVVGNGFDTVAVEVEGKRVVDVVFAVAVNIMLPRLKLLGTSPLIFTCQYFILVN